MSAPARTQSHRRRNTRGTNHECPSPSLSARRRVPRRPAIAARARPGSGRRGGARRRHSGSRLPIFLLASGHPCGSSRACQRLRDESTNEGRYRSAVVTVDCPSKETPVALLTCNPDDCRARDRGQLFQAGRTGAAYRRRRSSPVCRHGLAQHRPISRWPHQVRRRTSQPAVHLLYRRL